MSSSGRRRELGGGESAAFEKLTQGLRHAMEAASEISVLRSDPRWGQIGILLQQMLKKTNDLFMKRRIDAHIVN